MTLLAGTVSVSDTGVATGTGMALAIFNAAIARPQLAAALVSESVSQVARVAILRGIADQSTGEAIGIVGHITASGGVGYGTYANRPAAGSASRIYISGSTPVAQYVDDGSVWRPLIGGQQLGYEPPLVSTFTEIDVGTTTLADHYGSIRFTGLNDTTNARIRGATIPIGTVTAIEACVSFDPNPSNAAVSSNVGIGIIDLLTGKSFNFMLRLDHSGAAGGTLLGWAGNWSDIQTPGTTALVMAPPGPLFIRLGIVAGNIVAYWTTDRSSGFHAAGISASVATVFGATPTLNYGIVGVGLGIIPRANILSFLAT
jgi:hypothetical protein